MNADLSIVSEAFLQTPIGLLQLRANMNCLISIRFAATQQASFSSPQDGVAPFLKDAMAQLQSYFNTSKPAFDLPFSMEGTAFQKIVWSRLQKIPSGETCTYGELAKSLNTSPRAIGRACRENPLLILTPCHRVVAQNGLGGFSGKESGRFIDIKQWLLSHESKYV